MSVFAAQPNSRKALALAPSAHLVFSALLLVLLAATAASGSGESFTFAVLGDNRGDASGQLSAAFREVLAAVARQRPRFVLNTGDMIYGHTNVSAARQEWRRYLDAVAGLRVPVYHVPGNHDLWDADSASLYREVCGPTYFTFEQGPARFIGLDTESNDSRLGTEQLEWLKRQLAGAVNQPVFVMLHRPLFPAHEGIGSSLDVIPTERDELHRLFVQYRRSIKAVFLGHEHVYNFEERDGVRYYTSGGGGAELREAAELGGFHHFLLVRMSPDNVKIELRKVGAPAAAVGRPLRIRPGALLESWEQGLFWYAWDHTVTTELTTRRASQGARGLQFDFDLAQYSWPVLFLPLRPAWDLEDIDALRLDVYLPGRLKHDFILTPTLEGTREFAAPSVKLNPGWNAVRTELNAGWLPNPDRRAVRAISWSLERRPAVSSSAQHPTHRTMPAKPAETEPSPGIAAGNSADWSEVAGKQKGSLVFDNFCSESRPRDGAALKRLLEGWERGLLWRLVDETVVGDIEEGLATEGGHGLKVSFDFSNCPQPVLLARLNPQWDLRKPAALTVDIFAPRDLPNGVSVRLGLRAQEVSYLAGRVELRPGWNKVRVELNGGWLPDQVRAAAEQIEWRLNGSQPVSGWLVFDNLRAASQRP